MPQKSGIPAYIRRAQITKGGSTVSKKQEVMRGAAAPMRMILLYSRDYFKEHGYAPTLREIGDHTGLESMASVKYYMDKLYDVGMIESEHRGFPRAFRISEKGLSFLNP